MRNIRRLPTGALAALVFSLFFGSLARGAVLTWSYVNVQVSNNVSFATNAGNGSFVTNLAGPFTSPTLRVSPYLLASANPTSITLSWGQYLRFGIAIKVTDNPNPAAGGGWDLVNQDEGNPAQPANLGVSVVGLQVLSTDPDGSDLAAVVGGSRPGGGTRSKAVIVGPVGPAGGSWPMTEKGDVGTATLATNSDGIGDVGDTFPIGAGNISANSQTSGGIALLQNLAGPGFNTLFTGLMYHSIGFNAVDLTPVILPGAVSFWTNTFPGDPSNPDEMPAVYASRPFGPGDSIIPEPLSGMLSLTMGLGVLSIRRRRGRA